MKLPGAAVLLAATALATSCSQPAPLQPVAERPPPTAATTCPPDTGVTIEAGQTDAALGARGMRLTLVNCGAQPVELNGYADLRVLDAARKDLNIKIQKGTTSVEDPGPKRLTVRSGGRAAMVVFWRNTVTSADVPAVNGTHLQVVARPGLPAVTVAAKGPIDLGNTGRLETTAWRRA